jgi:phosphoribosyl 1,2-cyclic phosphate phosphodiesterase
VKITVLGSAAAEAIPNPFCNCSVCQKARQHGGRDCRARSSIIINDDLLVDFGPDIVSSVNRWRLYLGNLETLLITHGHEDHWLVQNLLWRRSTFTPNLKVHLSIFAPADLLGDLPGSLSESIKASWTPVSPGDTWTSGRYRITAIPATHGDGKVQALLYVVDDGKYRIFYATDTAPLIDKAWEILNPLGPMDLILLDATMGPADGGQSHHGISQFLKTRELMVEKGLFKPGKTLLIAQHFSHNSGLSHNDLVGIFSPYSVEVAYDGMVIDLA